MNEANKQHDYFRKSIRALFTRIFIIYIEIILSIV